VTSRKPSRSPSSAPESRGRSAVPAPPEPFEPLIETWPAGVGFYRVHSDRGQANAFNTGPLPQTRFAFFGNPAVPVLYAGETELTAVAETILHDVPLTCGRVEAPAYLSRQSTCLRPRRDLRLAQLHSGGLMRLGIEARRQLTDTPASQYDRTVTWAEAAHANTDVDGLVWMSRRWNGSKSIVLFGDRVSPDDLTVEAGYGRVFALPGDFDWLFDLCRTVGVSVAPPLI